MANIIVVAIIAGLVGAALRYIKKQKDKGVTCIGCPSAGTCGAKHGSQNGCSCCHQES